MANVESEAVDFEPEEDDTVESADVSPRAGLPRLRSAAIAGANDESAQKKKKETNPSSCVDNQREIAQEANIDVKVSKIKDIRNYLCKYCGIMRSKKYLITSLINSHHQMEVEEERDDEACEVEEEVSGKHTCHECDAEFKKPSHLKQHMQSHSLERSFACYVDDCVASYRRKDHLNRHVLTHKGKIFKCPVENCKSQFSVHGNVGRHVKKFHSKGDNSKDDSGKDDIGNGDSQPVGCSSGQKQLVCKEIGCGKAFKYASQLQKHQDSHVKLDSVEAFCSETGCMNNCEICGSKHLKKNIKRHLWTHAEDSSPGEFKCEVEGCSSTFSKASNLQKHVKAVHEDICPFVCGFPGCGMRFAYKHVRNNHENSGRHIYTCGDFVETDADFSSRPRGGVKRKQVTADMLIQRTNSRLASFFTCLKFC
ncbi:unnamed protein product [Arabis nemorensis]|uniref:C2H2-type domain-containing protein n=1 Tax=Arabis nemorensis TaxID=586526 RepID=A0A565BG27_9BRAS|nr:unnamed protein product [Arabis nemorensis]